MEKCKDEELNFISNLRNFPVRVVKQIETV